MLRHCVAAIACLLFSWSAAAQVTVSNPWVRGTVPGQHSTGAFMEISSTEPVVLVAIATPAAGMVEIHQMIRESGVMKMRQLPTLDIPAGRKIEMKPGASYHVMMMELRKPLKSGDTVPLKLTFRGNNRITITVEVQARVRALGAPP